MKEAKLKNIEVGDVLSEVFSTYFSKLKILFTFAFICFVIPAILSELTKDLSALYFLIQILRFILTFVFIGLSVFVVKDARENQDSEAGSILGLVAPNLLYLVIASVLKSIIIIIGLIFFVFPGIYLAIRLALAESIVVNESVGPIDAIKKSFEDTRDMTLRMFLIALVFFLIMIVGLILGAIALVVFILIALIAGDIAVMIAGIISGALFLAVVFQSLGVLWAPVVYFRLLEVEDSYSEEVLETEAAPEPATAPERVAAPEPEVVLDSAPDSAPEVVSEDSSKEETDPRD